MPAYRSDAEAAIRGDVVERLRQWRPEARIIHEINACDFGNRIDVLAVDRAEIIAVEIKSEKDKLDRAPAQIEAMRGVAHHTICAFHRRFLAEKQIGNADFADFHRDGVPFQYRVPEELKGSVPWIWPEPELRSDFKGWDMKPWREPIPAIQAALPPAAIHMLWRAELAELCAALAVPVPRRATMPVMIAALRWNATGAALTRGICAALRGRKCVEADAPLLAMAEDMG